jgi:RNA polymerase sigma factor (sigma-70 family)
MLGDSHVGILPYGISRSNTELNFAFSNGYHKSSSDEVCGESRELASMSHDDHSTQIRRCIDRLRAGDRSARDELLEHACDRLVRLTRKMLRDFPGVERWDQNDDVLQNAALRLCRALDAVQPPTAVDFFRLAAAEIRRELLDLARRFAGAHGIGANHASIAGSAANAGDVSAKTLGHIAGDATHDHDRLEAWTDFHRHAEELPPEERETFDLLYYQGVSQTEAAAILDISERTIKRRWQSARLRLHDALEGRMPGL